MSEQTPPPVQPRPPDAQTLTRSEERLTAHTQRSVIGTARLEKYVVTEQRTITVDVAREEIRLVYDDTTQPPPADPDAVTAGAAAPPAPDTVVLWAEQIEVTRHWVPVETARLDITTVTTTQTVTDTVRTEHIAPHIAATTDATGPTTDYPGRGHH